MSILDIILLIIFVFAGFHGYRKGLIGQAAGLIGLLLGIWAAIHFSDFTASILTDSIGMKTKYIFLISFAITFVVVLVAVHFVAVIAEKLIDLAFLGIANKLLGVVFGVLKNALIISIIILLLGKLNDRVNVIPKDFGENSFLYGPVKRLAPRIFPYLKFDELKKEFVKKNDTDND